MLLMQIPTHIWAGSSVVLATGSLVETATQGGTLGGQALLFAAVIVLGWVVVALFKGLNKNSAELVASVIKAANDQREEDRKHHQEIVEAFRSERGSNIAERGTNFATLLSIARDSATALAAAAHAARETTIVCRDNTTAIHELSLVMRELGEMRKPEIEDKR